MNALLNKVTLFLQAKKYYLVGIGAAIVGLAITNRLAPAFFAEKVFPWLLLVGAGGIGYLIFKLHEKQHYKFLHNARGRYPDLLFNQTVLGEDGTSGLLLDEKNGQLAVFEGDYGGQYAYRDVIRSEVIEDGGSVSSTVRSSQAIGAIVGNIAFGGAGFIVGALSGKSRSRNEISSVSVAITFNDSQYPLHTIVFLSASKPILRSSKKAKGAIAQANRLHSLCSVLIRRADNEVNAESVRPQEKVAASVAKLALAAKPALVAQPAPLATTATVVQPNPSQLPEFDRASFAKAFLKLAKLKEQGHLTEQEFADLKNALMSQTKAKASSTS